MNHIVPWREVVGGRVLVEFAGEDSKGHCVEAAVLEVSPSNTQVKLATPVPSMSGAPIVVHTWQPCVSCRVVEVLPDVGDSEVSVACRVFKMLEVLRSKLEHEITISGQLPEGEDDDRCCKVQCVADFTWFAKTLFFGKDLETALKKAVEHAVQWERQYGSNKKGT